MDKINQQLERYKRCKTQEDRQRFRRNLPGMGLTMNQRLILTQYMAEADDRRERATEGSAA